MPHVFLTTEELEIRRFQGIQQPSERLHVGPGLLSPGLTVLFGPNGSGKSTIARALRSLLWPDSCPETHVGLAGVWRCGDRTLSVRLDGRLSGCTSGGCACAFPSLPPIWKPYFLALQDLLVEDDDDLAAVIQREMYGSIDLDGAVRQLGLAESRSGFQKAHAVLTDARKKRRETSAAQRGLADRAAELEHLRAQIAESAAAREKIRLYEELIRWHERQRELTVCGERINAFAEHDVLRSLRGDEYEQFQTLRDAIRENERLRADLEDAIATARDQRGALGFEGADVPSEGQFVKLQDFAAAVQRLDDQLAEKQQALVEISAAEQAARRFSGGRLMPDAAAQTTAAEVENLFPLFDDWRRDRQRWEAAQAALKAQQALLGEGRGDCDAEAGVDCLLDWLGTPPDAARSRSSGIVLSLLIACLVAVLSAFWSPWVLLVLPLVFLPLLADRVRTSQTPGGQAAIRGRLAEKYDGLKGVPPIANWDEKTVREQVHSLESMIVLQRENASIATRVQWLEEQLEESLRAYQETEQRLQDGLRQRGLACSTVPEDGGRLAGAVVHWQEICGKVDSLRQGLEALQQTRQTRLDECGALCAHLGISRPQTAADIREQATDLAGRTTRWHEKEREIIQWQERLEQARRDLQENRRRLDELTRRLSGNAEPEGRDAEEKIRMLVSQVEPFREAAEDLRKAQVSVAETRALLGTLPGFDEASLQLPPEKLPPMLEECRRQAADSMELSRQLGDLEGALDRCRQGHDLEVALAEEAEAEDHLRGIRDRALDEAVGLSLVDLLRERAGQLSSAVLKRGRKIFADVTAGRYELLVENRDGRMQLLARDTVTEARRSLAQLSSGTRVQLLLSARLAFLEEQERDVVSPPLVLDEILANSDDLRTRAIMQFILHVVETGRQVIYLTAQEDELAKWNSLLAEKPDCRWGLVQLPLDQPKPAFSPGLRVLAERSVPPPGDQSYDEYGEALGVPPFPLLGGSAADFHVFYVLCNTDALYAALQAGCRQAGQLELFLKTVGDAGLEPGGFGDGETVRQKVTARIALLKHLQETYRCGRGLPVGPDVVLDPESPVARLKSAEEIAELVRRLEGDGNALIAALRNREIKGFQQKKVDDLEDWLTDAGYLDPRPPCPLEELIPQVLAETASLLEHAGISLAGALEVLDRALEKHGIFVE